MKVCIVSLNMIPYLTDDHRAQYGGAEVQAAFLADALAARGHVVSMVVTDLTPDTAMPHEAENAYRSRDGVRGVRFWHPRLTGTIGALERADADVYYQRNAGSITGLVGLFCRRRRKVFVYGAGSDTDFSFRRVRVAGLRDKTLYYMGLKLATGIVVQNQRQRDLCSQTVTTPIRVIPNGVRPATGAIDEDRGVIAWVGALRRVKRPDLLLELATMMPDRRFLVVGGSVASEPAFAEKMRDVASELSNVEMTGRLPHGEVLERIRDAAVLVNTSSVEGFPNAYLEAWNYGVPVVSFNDVDGMIGEKGLGAVCGGVEEMSRVLAKVLDDPVERRAMGERARALVAERFSPPVLAAQYEEFFAGLLEANSASTGASVETT